MGRLKAIIAFTGAVLLLLPLLASAQPRAPRPWDTPVVCPKCASDQVVYILYGEPDLDDNLKRALASHRVELGGCIVTSESLKWECRQCGHKWGPVQRQNH